MQSALHRTHRAGGRGWLETLARDQRPPLAGYRCTSTASPCPCRDRLCVPVPIPLSTFTGTPQGRLWAALARLVPVQSRYDPDTTAITGRRQGGGDTGGKARFRRGCAGLERRGWRKTGTRRRITQRYQRDDADMSSALVQDVPVFIGFPQPPSATISHRHPLAVAAHLDRRAAQLAGRVTPVPCSTPDDRRGAARPPNRNYFSA